MALIVTPERGRGLHPTPPSKRSHRLGAAQHAGIAAALRAGPVGAQDFSDAVRIWNQGRCSGCWAHAESTLLEATRKLQGTPLDAPPSPLFFMQANYARLRGIAYPSGPLPVLTDDGAQLEDAAASSALIGEVSMQAPQQDGNTDVPATIGDLGEPIPLPEMTVDEVQAGSESIFDGEYSIDVGPGVEELLMATLDSTILLWDGFYADMNCETLRPGQVLGAPDMSQKGGGHSNGYCGYKLVSPSRPLFKKFGTWGTGYCEGGFYWVDVDHVRAAWSLWPFALRPRVQVAA